MRGYRLVFVFVVIFCSFQSQSLADSVNIIERAPNYAPRVEGWIKSLVPKKVGFEVAGVNVYANRLVDLDS